MHKLKEKFMDELYALEEKAEKSSARINEADLNKIHKLTDTIKNIDKIEMLEEGGGYSEESNWMGEGRMYGTSYEGGSSYARGGRGRGRNAKRDSMGRYSSEGRYSRESGYSEEGSYRGGSYEGGGSYARGGQGNQGGRGGYSRNDASEMLMEKAEEMLEMTQEPKERRAIEKLIRELED